MAKSLEDLQTAVRWVRLNAGTFHIDAGRIVAMGESASGPTLRTCSGTGSDVAGIAGSDGIRRS